MARKMLPRPGARLPLLAMWLFLHHVLTSASASRFEIIPGQTMVSVPPLDAKPVDDIRQCSVLCHGLSSCWAFNHHSNSTCQLLPAAPEVCQGDVNVSHLVTEPGGSVGLPSGVCPRTCQQLRRLQPTAASGVYQLVGWPVPVLCDQELDGGGWTLVVSSVSQTWTPDGTVSLVTGRNQQTPDIAADYSILEHGDFLLSFGTGDRFLYRLEGQTQTGRRQWGGIWSAPRTGSVVRYSPGDLTKLVTRFGPWTTSTNSIESRLPWINTGFFTDSPSLHYVLTTSSDTAFWGNLITRVGGKTQHSRWMRNYMVDSGNVLYWMRENE